MRYTSRSIVTALVILTVTVCTIGWWCVTRARPRTYQLAPIGNGFVDHEGHEVIRGDYEAHQYFFEGLACVRREGKLGYVDMTGNWVIPPQFDEGLGFSEGLAPATLAGKTGFVDRAGVFLEVAYDQTQGYSEGVAAVCHGAKWGFIDRSGHLVIPTDFSFATRFSEGLAAVLFPDAPVGAGLGYIDHQGRTKIAPRFLTAGPFVGGVAHVRVGDRRFRIDVLGNEIRD